MNRCLCELHAGGNDDDDMFASDEEPDKAKPQPAATGFEPQQGDKQQQPQQQPATIGQEAARSAAADSATAAAPAAPPAAAPAAPPAAPAVDYSSWPVKELRRFLTERGVDSSSVVEKQELVGAVSAAL